MYCPHCGQKIADDAKFCMYCGKPVTPAAQEPGRNSGAEGDGTSFGSGRGQIGAENDIHRLKYVDHVVNPQDDFSSRSAYAGVSREKGKTSKGKGMFIVLCAAIVLLAGVITWQVLTIVSLNRSKGDFVAPKLTESEVSSALESTEESTVEEK